MRSNPTLFLGLFLVSVAATGHDFWVEPDTFTPTQGESVSIELVEGEELRGDTLPYIDDWFTDFSRVTAAGRDNVESIVGNDPAAKIVATQGQTLLGYQSVRAFVELDAAKFNSYLENEGIEFLREERRALGEDDNPAPEYFVRCAKSLLQANSGNATVFNKVLGYTLELTPQSDPYQAAIGDAIEFELKFRDQPAEGLLVQAFTKEQPEDIQKVRTDAQGRATITVKSEGTWIIKAVNIQRIIGDPRALWQSWWASYLFRAE